MANKSKIFKILPIIIGICVIVFVILSHISMPANMSAYAQTYHNYINASGNADDSATDDSTSDDSTSDDSTSDSSTSDSSTSDSSTSDSSTSDSSTSDSSADDSATDDSTTGENTVYAIVTVYASGITYWQQNVQENIAVWSIIVPIAANSASTAGKVYENIQAAESRIRDVDMASEMICYSDDNTISTDDIATQAKSTEKLSSGYKINRACDDAAMNNTISDLTVTESTVIYAVFDETLSGSIANIGSAVANWVTGNTGAVWTVRMIMGAVSVCGLVLAIVLIAIKKSR